MKKKIILLSLLSGLLSVSAFSHADMKFLTANDYNNSQIRGFNIGVLETHSDTYYKELSETKINAVRVIVPFRRCTLETQQPKDIDKKKITSVNDVKADAMTGVPKCVYEISPENSDKFKALLKKAVEYNFYVIPVAEFQQNPAGDFWTVPKLQQGLTEAWKDFANQYKEYSVIAGYDLMDNPSAEGLPAGSNVSEYWQKGASYMIQGIRSVDKKHTIIYPMAPSGMPVAFKDFKPFEDKNVVYGINMYYPLDLTMQGTSENFSYRIPYPAGLEYGIQPIPNQPPRVIDVNDLRLYLQDAGLFAKTNNVPVMVLEFGIVHYAPNGSSFRYVSDTTKIFEDNGWSWTYQGFRVSAAFDPYIGSDDPENTTRSFTSPIMNVLTSYFQKNSLYYK